MRHDTVTHLRWPIAIAAAVCLFAAALFFSQPPPEPVWKGEPFSYWVREKGSDDPQIAAHAERGMIEMAPQAVPYLLHGISRKDSKLVEVVNKVLIELPGDWTSLNDESETRRDALEGFRALGPLAKAAIPKLEKLLLDEDITFEVAIALANIGGSRSVPALCAALTNGPTRAGVAALDAMFELGTNGAAALPTLLQLSNSTNLDIQLRAIHLLGFVGKNQPERVLPALLTSLRTLPRGELLSPLLGLGELGSAARTAAPDILGLVTNTSNPAWTDRGRRSTATKTLVKILGNDALPPLLQMLSHEDLHSVFIAMRGLGELGTNAAPAVPLLIPLTTNQSVHVAGEAIYTLGKIGSQPELVVPALIPSLTHTNEFISVRAAMVLSLFGADAHAAVPVLTPLAETSSLRTSFQSHDHWVRKRLGLPDREEREPFRFALELIDPKAAGAVPKK